MPPNSSVHLKNDEISDGPQVINSHSSIIDDTAAQATTTDFSKIPSGSGAINNFS